MATKIMSRDAEDLLPDKPSDLIEVALNDLRRVRKSKKFKIDMYDWFSGQLDGRCSVCLAGAVMAKTLNLKVSEGDTLIPNCNLRVSPVSAKLEALNSFRTGEVIQGLRDMGIYVDTLSKESVDEFYAVDGTVPYYSAVNSRPFFNAMRKMIEVLRKYNL